MQNPDLIRTVIMNNPQLREVPGSQHSAVHRRCCYVWSGCLQMIERNPEVGHVLNDPAVSPPAPTTPLQRVPITYPVVHALKHARTRTGRFQ